MAKLDDGGRWPTMADGRGERRTGDEPSLTAKQVAAALHTSVYTVGRLIRSGDIHTENRRAGRPTLVAPSAVAAYLNRTAPDLENPMLTLPDEQEDLRLYTLDEVVEKTGLMKWRIQKACAARAVAHHRVGRQPRMSASQIRELVKHFDEPTAPKPVTPPPPSPDEARFLRRMQRDMRKAS